MPRNRGVERDDQISHFDDLPTTGPCEFQKPARFVVVVSQQRIPTRRSARPQAQLRGSELCRRLDDNTPPHVYDFGRPP